MYQNSDLLNIRKAFRFCPTGITLEDIEKDAQEFSDKFAVPLAWERTQVDNGANAPIPIQDSLVLFHPDHKNDYYCIVVNFEVPTKLAHLFAYIAGESANGITRSGATALIQGGKMALGNLANGNTETGNPEDCAAEKQYYAQLFDIINALIGAGEV